MKSGNLNFLEPAGPLRVCNRTALPIWYTVSAFVGVWYSVSFFCLPYPISAHLISFQFFWHRMCNTDACVFFTSFDVADDMLVHVILIVGSCYIHTTTQRANYINIFFFVYYNCGVLHFGVLLVSKSNCRTTVANWKTNQMQLLWI